MCLNYSAAPRLPINWRAFLENRLAADSNRFRRWQRIFVANDL
jgi:hypothetical protein